MADNPDPRDLAFRALDLNAQAEELVNSEQGRANRPSFTELYRYVHGQRLDVWDDFAQVMRTFPDAAKDFEHLIQNTAYAIMPQLAAAAGAAVQLREHDGYALKVTESRAEPNQVYLSIEAGIDLVDPPRGLFMKSIDSIWHELIIPPMTNGRAQIVLDKDNPAVRAFGQPDTVIYIR